MKTPRLAAAGLTVFASVALAMTGCTSSSNTPSGGSSASSAPSSAAARSATEKVQAAVKKLNDTSYKYTIGMSGLTGQGSVDPTAKKASLSWTSKMSGLNVKWDLLQVGSDYWMKLDLGGQNAALGLSNKWMHVDPSKVKNGADFGIDLSKVDPTRVSGLFDGLTDAKQVDATHYDVTLDLTKSTGGVISSTTLTKLGDKAKSMPAKVTLDDQGRLAAVALDLSSVDADSSINTTYSDYGTPVAISAPVAADTVEAPAALYQIFNGS